MTSRAPTIDDLRVKLCYICREEERYDEKLDHPTAWTHPCKCTLIAHEQCLLKWIQTSQTSSARAANALKCPQCGARYELESKHPMLLRMLSAGNRALQKLGRMFTLFGVATFVAVVGSSVYIILTSYGAWSLKQFIGKEMFDVLLTNDPKNWPWAAFINLPLLPISLIISRMRASSSIPAIIPILLVWPPSPPVGLREKLLREYWTNPSNARKLAMTPLPPTRSWPPSPFAVGLFFIPLARNIYRILYARLALRVLGAKAASLLPGVRRQIRAQARRNGQEERDAGAEAEQAEQQQQRGEQQQQQQQQQQQVVWQWNGFGPFGFLRIRANMEEVAVNEGQQQPGDQRQNNEANGNADGNMQPQPNPDANAAVVEAAEQQIEVNTTSLGRHIGGALLIPAISSWMGSLLFGLSRHSSLLSEFLGIKASSPKLDAWRAGFGVLNKRDDDGGMPGGFLLLPPPPMGPWSYGSWEGLSTWEQVKLVLKLTLSATWGGTRTWAESDPVWWRNSIGLGLFVVAKDCLQLLHLWLTKRELETRRVKSRDFEGVDEDELDLIPGFR